MKKVIFINEGKEQVEKPVEFTHIMEINGFWSKLNNINIIFDNVLYQGFDKEFDYFLCWDNGVLGNVGIYRGHLNSGKY